MALASPNHVPKRTIRSQRKNHLNQDSYESNLVSFLSHYPAFRPRSPCFCLLTKGLTSAIFFSVIFVCKMCIVVSRPMKIVTFLRKTVTPQNGVVDFPLERDTFRNKIMEIVKDFDEQSYNNNGKPCESSWILRVTPNFFIFHFSFFFIFPHFSFLFLFLFWVARFVLGFFGCLHLAHRRKRGCSKSDFFFGLSCLHFLCQKSFFEPSRGVPLWPLFSFFSLVYIFLKKFFLMFFIFFFHFFSRKSFFFSFFLYFFQMYSIAGISIRVYCFLRSRCSMEMWCPDDIGRDSWDWVGPPAWERA